MMGGVARQAPFSTVEEIIAGLADTGCAVILPLPWGRDASEQRLQPPDGRDPSPLGERGVVRGEIVIFRSRV